jgi:peptidoglycan biosynthesis protein MviN/MurJ (putative lipid II flippase)
VLVMAAVLFAAMGPSAWWLAAGWEWKIPAVLGLVLLGSATYGACLVACGFRPRHFSRRAAA